MARVALLFAVTMRCVSSSLPAPLSLCLLLALCAPWRAAGCYLQGYDSGYCASTAGSFVQTKIPYCAQYATGYPSVCLPKEYDYFPNNTATAKDTWVSGQVYDTISRRQAIEEKNGDTFVLGAWGPGFAPVPRDPPYTHTHTHTQAHTRARAHPSASIARASALTRTHVRTHATRPLLQRRTNPKRGRCPSASSKTRRAKPPLRGTCAT